MPHHCFFRHPRSLFARLLAACLIASVAHAAPSDETRLSTYRLNMNTLKKMEAASANIAAAIRQQPSLASDDDSEDDLSLSEMVAAYNSRPALRQGILKAGLSTDEFVLCALSLMQAGMTAALVQNLPPAKQGKAIADSGTPAANVEFYRQNKTYLDAMGKRLQALKQ